MSTGNTDLAPGITAIPSVSPGDALRERIRKAQEAKNTAPRLSRWKLTVPSPELPLKPIEGDGVGVDGTKRDPRGFTHYEDVPARLGITVTKEIIGPGQLRVIYSRGDRFLVLIMATTTIQERHLRDGVYNSDIGSKLWFEIRAAIWGEGTPLSEERKQQVLELLGVDGQLKARKMTC